MLQLSSEFLFTTAGSLVMALITLVSWLIRLESKASTGVARADEVETSLLNRINETNKATIERINDVSIQSIGRFSESVKNIERADGRIDRVEQRAEQASSEVRIMLMAIQKSLSQLEGQFFVNNRKGKNDE